MVTEQLAPRGSGSPLHVHHNEDEWFYVLEGELTIWVDGHDDRGGAGAFVFGPRDVPHTFVVSSERARFLLVTEPAGFEGFVRALADPAPARRSRPPRRRRRTWGPCSGPPPTTGSRSSALPASRPDGTSRGSNMSTETMSKVASAEDNRSVARRWIDAFNARDDDAEAAARTADYIAHAPDSIQTAALDSDAWVEFLGVFLEGFPDLHLEVLDSSADEGWSRSASCSPARTPAPSEASRRPTGRSASPDLEINRMVDGKVAEHWFQLDAVTLFEQLGLRVVPGPRLLSRLIASPVTRLLGKRRRTVRS